MVTRSDAVHKASGKQLKTWACRMPVPRGLCSCPLPPLLTPLLCSIYRNITEMMTTVSLQIVGIIEPIIQHADWFFPGGNVSAFTFRGQRGRHGDRKRTVSLKPGKPRVCTQTWDGFVHTLPAHTYLQMQQALE